MTTVSLGDLFEFARNTKHPASCGIADGAYPFFLSSQDKVLTTNNPDIEGPALIFGNGGSASVHCVEGPFSASNHCYIAFPKNRQVDEVRFYNHYLKSNIHLLEAGFKGVGLKNISKSYLSSLPLLAAADATKRRVVAILDKAEGIRRKRKQIIDLTDSLLNSLFLQMFGDPLTNPNGWPEVLKLGDIAEIVSGITKGRKLNSQTTRGVPYLAVINVQDRHLKLNPLKTIEATENEIKKYRLKENDLLLTEGGDPDKLGRGTLWRNELTECIYQNHVFRVRIHDKNVNPVFLNSLIGSSRGKIYFLKSAKQTTGIATINKGQLEKFPLLLPPITLQRQFEEVRKSIRTIECKIKLTDEADKDLFVSLSNHVFHRTMACP
ncbi:MAG: restriction endonuclease subunit S [Gammaproteobacteria bacterium]|nr:restriction endonuclease subunit S [Gammaproteobacteria bacterium]